MDTVQYNAGKYDPFLLAHFMRHCNDEAHSSLNRTPGERQLRNNNINSLYTPGDGSTP